jgi:hypothetical protein
MQSKLRQEEKRQKKREKRGEQTRFADVPRQAQEGG